MNETIGLTQADRRKLGDMAANGAEPYMDNGGRGTEDGVPVTCHRCGYAWRYTGTRTRATCSSCGYKTAVGDQDARRLSPEMCNAIREAARDGLAYREIADLFGFIEDAAPAWEHATGRCGHNGDCVPPVASMREPGNQDAVDAAECADLRRRFDSGASTTEIAEAVGRHRTTVGTHVYGRCKHE